MYPKTDFNNFNRDRATFRSLQVQNFVCMFVNARKGFCSDIFFIVLHFEVGDGFHACVIKPF